MKKISIFAVSALMLVSFSYNGDSSKKGLLKGEEVKIHGGKGWSWAKVSKKGNPESVGFTLTDEALASVPLGNGTGGHNAHGPAHEHWIAKFNPIAGTVIPFNFVMLNWNPNGHPPENIYDKPHFDFHFYMISLKEQLAIPSYEDASSLFDNLPPAEYLPSLYFRGPGGVPQMGVHWVDILSPEFNGGDFTTTFLYGSYDGKVTFHEPMVTMNVIESGATIHKDIRQPQLFSLSNRYFPTEYSIWKDSRTGRHYLSLNTMVLR